jgi:hypothetical protein
MGTEKDLMPGAYTTFHCVDAKEQELFKKVTETIVGVDYEAVAVATQVVAGTNYKFFCNARIVYPEAPYYTAMVIVFQPLPGQGDATVTEIRKISY